MAESERPPVHDVGIDRERAVGDDVATLIVGNIAIVDEAQSVGVERLLVFENQRQVRAGQTQVPQASTSRSVRKLVENRIMSGCDRVLVDGGAGFRGGSATVTQVRRLARHGDQRGAPAIVVDFAQIPEIAYGLHAEHAIETGVASGCRESK